MNIRKSTLEKYVKAARMMKNGVTQTKACETADISRMTFNKYRDMFGDEIAPNKFEITPIEAKKVPVKEVMAETTSDLELLLKENAALAEQLKLRQELAKYVH